LKVAVTNQQVAIYFRNGGRYIMGIREELERVRDLDIQISILSQEVERLRGLVMKSGGVIKVKSKSVNTPKSPQEKYISSIIEKTEKMEKATKEMLQISNDLFDLVMLLEDKREAQVLYLRYFQGKSWYEISEEVDKSRAHLYRLHNNGIENLEKNLEKFKNDTK
jgi:DNA-directed RNA polymerase specialized sigma subunit